MNPKAFLVLCTLIFLSGCSSLSFIPTPPAMTVATTDYVDKAVARQIYKSKEIIVEEAKKAIEKMLEVEREKIDSLTRILEEQGNILEITSQRLKELALVSEQLKLADVEMEKRVSSVVDSIGIFLSTMDELKNKNLEILREIERLRGEVTGVPEQTLRELIEAINSYYGQKK